MGWIEDMLRICQSDANDPTRTCRISCVAVAAPLGKFVIEFSNSHREKSAQLESQCIGDILILGCCPTNLNPERKGA